MEFPLPTTMAEFCSTNLKFFYDIIYTLYWHVPKLVHFQIFFYAIDNLRPPSAGTPLKGVFKISNHSFSTTDINFKNFLELTKILSFSTNKNFQLFLAFDDQNSSSKN